MPRYIRIVACIFVILAAASAGPAAAQVSGKEVAREVEWRVHEGHADFGSDVDDELLFQVYAFYHDRNYTPMWVRDDGPKTKAWVLLQRLRDAEMDGLVPGDYHPEEIAKLMEAANPADLARAEIGLTRVFLRYAQDLRTGRVRPSEVDDEIHIAPPEVNSRAFIDGAEDAEDLGPYIETLEPQTPQYARLKYMLQEYRQIAAKGGWPLVPEGETLKPGMDDSRVPVVRQYLAMTGDYTGDAADTGTLYDGDIVAAVERFQERHGIDVDGAIGPSTLAQMRVPVEERIETMVLNLERRRWMPDDLGDRYVFVNLADQFLKLVEFEDTVHTARLVVGKPYTRTPIFSDEIEYAVINPDWTVPASIIRNEYIPLLRKDPNAMAARNIRVYMGNAEIDPRTVGWRWVEGTGGFTMRQDPGPTNALGAIKFMFPNRFNVYIHDTPSKGLFSRSSRVFSHGCMRIENPFEFGGALLEGEGWTADRLQRVQAAGRKTVVTLEKKVPVHVTYLTAWVNKDATVHFRRDVYGRDEKLIAALRSVGSSPQVATSQ